MRQRLNDNPLVAVGLLAVLAIPIAFLMLGNKGSSTPATPATAAPVAGTSTTPTAVSTAPSTATAPSASSASTATVAGFRPGPGLPSSVVKAYRRGDVVALFVTKPNGIDDRAVRAALARAHKAPDVSVFRADLRHVSAYSRIASGVDLDRAPALVTLRTRRGKASAPVAAVSYGFSNPETISQAFRDAAYRGPDNLPYYPR